MDTLVNARIDEAVDRLADEFKGIFSPESVSKCAFESLRAFEQSRLVEFVPLLTYRFTRERLLALAQADGLTTKEMPEVLFVCVHNAGRSQMAAALTAALSDGRVHVRSAGSAPAANINPAVIYVMNEVGLDLAIEYPKPLTDEVVRAADVVITMGCGDACPALSRQGVPRLADRRSGRRKSPAGPGDPRLDPGEGRGIAAQVRDTSPQPSPLNSSGNAPELRSSR